MLPYTIPVLLLVAVASVHCAKMVNPNNLVCDGRNVSANQQCINKKFKVACKVPDPSERCSQLKCTGSNHMGDIPIYIAYGVGPALQGTSCGVNKICIGARCVNDPNPPANTVMDNSNEIECDEEEEEAEIL